MNICDITNFFSPKSGGVKTYLTHKQEYIRAFNGAHRHLLIVPGPESRTVRNGVCSTSYVEGPVVSWERNYRFIKNLNAVTEIIVRELPDVVEIGSPYLIPWAVRRVSRHFRIPVVGFFHSNFPETYVRRVLERTYPFIAPTGEGMAWAYARLVYSFCDAVIATSRHAEERLNRHGIRHTVRIPFGVDHALFDPNKRRQDIRQELGIDADRTMLLYVGRLSNEKNLQLLVDAYEHLRSLAPKTYCVVIVGSGPNQEIMSEKAESTPHFHYLGYRGSQDGLPDIYAAADIFVSPSPNETFGLSPLEALSSGLPVVAVSGGAVSEILPPGAHELADPASPISLAEAIDRMRVRLHPGMSKEIRKFAVEQFSWEQTFGNIFALYERLIRERRK